MAKARVTISLMDVPEVVYLMDVMRDALESIASNPHPWHTCTHEEIAREALDEVSREIGERAAAEEERMRVLEEYATREHPTDSP